MITEFSPQHTSATVVRFHLVASVTATLGPDETAMAATASILIKFGDTPLINRLVEAEYGTPDSALHEVHSPGSPLGVPDIGFSLEAS